MEGIRPGDYHVFVWEFIPRNAWLNADYMRQFEGMGQPIRIHEGDSSDAESVELRIIPGDPR
jgi:hypothetical protein